MNKQQLFTIIKDNLLSKKSLYCFITFIFIFLCYYRYVKVMFFDTDEGDIFAGGFALSKGFLLYKDFLSQHTPISYFVSAFFHLLGAHSVYWQRVCFYALYSLAFTWIIFHYSKKNINYLILLFCPLFFVTVIKFIYFSASILSEHLTAIGFLLLYLELYTYNQCAVKKFHTTSCAVISLSLLLTVGTTFVSLFGLAVLFFGFVFSFFKNYAFVNVKQLLKDLVSHYYLVVLFCAVPWVILFLYFIATGTLSDAIYWMYTFNREVYSKYLNGFGSSIILAVRDSIFHFYRFFYSIISSEKFDISVILEFLLYLFSLMFVISNFVRKKILLGIVSLLLFPMLSIRGIYNFHSIQCTLILCLFSACYLFEIYCSHLKNHGIKTVVVFFVCILVAPYFMDDFHFPKFRSYTYESTESSLIKRFLGDDDWVWNLALAHNNEFLSSERVGLYGFAIVPWFWEATGMNAVNELKEKGLPKVALYNENQVVWGYHIKNYASELVEFMNNNYTRYAGLVYVRNDYYNELKLLDDYFNYNADSNF